jgi:hypothetical protein
VLNTGHEKMRVTIILCARSDGKKMPPFVLLPKKRPDPKIQEKYGKVLHLVWSGKIWMDDFLTSVFLNRVFGPKLFVERLLVWDSFRCHISVETKKLLKKLGIDSAVVPGGCTKFVQVIFKLFILEH